MAPCRIIDVRPVEGVGVTAVGVTADQVVVDVFGARLALHIDHDADVCRDRAVAATYLELARQLRDAAEQLGFRALMHELVAEGLVLPDDLRWCP